MVASVRRERGGGGRVEESCKMSGEEARVAATLCDLTIIHTKQDETLCLSTNPLSRWIRDKIPLSDSCVNCVEVQSGHVIHQPDQIQSQPLQEFLLCSLCDSSILIATCTFLQKHSSVILEVDAYLRSCYHMAHPPGKGKKLESCMKLMHLYDERI